jgi:hypothetical protein
MLFTTILRKERKVDLSREITYDRMGLKATVTWPYTGISPLHQVTQKTEAQ